MRIKLNSEIYPLEAILNACYVFVDRAYIFLDSNHKKEIRASLKGKKKLSAKETGELKNEFMNELLHSVLRYRISKNNKKIREYIIGRALYSALPTLDLLISDKEMDYQQDPLGIALSWEEKYGKKKKNGRVKV